MSRNVKQVNAKVMILESKTEVINKKLERELNNLSVEIEREGILFEALDKDIRENIKVLAFFEGGIRKWKIQRQKLIKFIEKNSRFPRIRNVLRCNLSIRRKRYQVLQKDFNARLKINNSI